MEVAPGMTEQEYKNVYHRSSNNGENHKDGKNRRYIILRPDQIEQVVTDCIGEILAKEESYQGKGSGWSLERVDRIDVSCLKYQPTGGASYIPTQPEIASRKATINVKKEDNLCFIYSILAKLYPAESNAHRVSKYVEYLDKINCSGLEMPMKLKNIKQFEKLNLWLSIMVYQINEDEKTVRPVYVSTNKSGKEIGIDEDTNEEIKHYILITDLNKVLFRSTKYEHKKSFCRYCIMPVAAEELAEHKLKCIMVSVSNVSWRRCLRKVATLNSGIFIKR